MKDVVLEIIVPSVCAYTTNQADCCVWQVSKTYDDSRISCQPMGNVVKCAVGGNQIMQAVPHARAGPGRKEQTRDMVNQD